MSKPTGVVCWVTGLSGAGKTTLAKRVHERRAALHPTVLLDGDILRAVFVDPPRFDRESRLGVAYRNARLCRMLSDQGIDVVCATISLYWEVQRWSRENIPNYREVLVRAPLEDLRARDAKGVYASTNVVGVDIEPELPKQPDLVVDNPTGADLDLAERRILEAIWPRE